jgi:hypothetical protein
VIARVVIGLACVLWLIVCALTAELGFVFGAWALLAGDWRQGGGLLAMASLALWALKPLGACFAPPSTGGWES